jgi:hypothetical protein
MVNNYQIKVQLLGVTKPPIWRQIQVPSDITLYLLHCCIQGAMGWLDGHLHQFIVGDQLYGIPYDDYGIETKDGRKKTLKTVLKKVGDYMDYEYDFGDGWVHRITLEKILPTNPTQKSLVLLKGKGACPPEDCGGIWGYENLKEVMKNPDHEEYQHLSDWLGGIEEWDANEFDLEEHQEGMIDAYEMGVESKGEMLGM